MSIPIGSLAYEMGEPTAAASRFSARFAARLGASNLMRFQLAVCPTRTTWQSSAPSVCFCQPGSLAVPVRLGLGSALHRGSRTTSSTSIFLPRSQTANLAQASPQSTRAARTEPRQAETDRVKQCCATHDPSTIHARDSTTTSVTLQTRAGTVAVTLTAAQMARVGQFDNSL